MREFVQSQYTEEEKVAYNEAVSSGDFGKSLAAVNAAKARYAAEFGKETTPLGGKTPKATEGYADMKAMKKDMSDPRYKTSEAFRKQVEAKIAKSAFLTAR
ncbi:hypothetical protein [uncultured Tateyamaria sp.]|uniref:capsid assembly protein n=1 Tax=uncultured Tateyamaria sp. TaxID=455651 RepID=UPI00345A534F